MYKNFSRVAKISRPTIVDVVHRKRLLELLKEKSQERIVWLAAPAGSGKTTLVADYLDNQNSPCLWYKIDKGDTDPASFFFYFKQAVSNVDPELGKTLPLLTPEYLSGLTVFAKTYFERVFQSLSSSYTLVIDNYHEAEDSPRFNDIIHILTQTIPSGHRLIILSRGEPPNRMSRFRAQGNNILYWSDIRFTSDETLSLLQLKGYTDEVDTLHNLFQEKTDGWIAGLILLIEWQKRVGSESMSLQQETPEEIFGYFSNEIISAESREMQDFLCKSSLLPSMTPQQAQRLTEESSTESILAALARKHFFIEKSISNGTKYSYHPLFREFLLKTAKNRFGEREIQSLRRKGGAILQDEGEIEDGVKLFIEGEDWQNVAHLLIAFSPQLLAQGRGDTLSNWFEAVPQNVQDSSPWLLYWRGVCTLHRNPPAAQKVFEETFSIFTEQKDARGSLLAWSGIINATFFSFDNFSSLDSRIDWLEEWLEKNPVFPSRDVEVSVATSMLIALIHRKPGSPRFEEWETRIILSCST